PNDPTPQPPPPKPQPQEPVDSHGTAVAGLAGARGFNGIGLVGGAPEARLMGLRLIAGPSTDAQEGQALGWQPPGATVHVSNNSWGKPDDGVTLGTFGPLLFAGMRRATTQNRGGLGTVIAISAGNGRTRDDDSSYDAFASSRFAVGVAAVNRQGK